MQQRDFDIYSLTRNFFDWSFENPEKINTNHVALYYFILEHSNRLGWKEKFGLPTGMAMEAIGIKNYKTYGKTFTDLVEFGFVKLIEKSKNQYSSNVIALVKNTKAHTKALTKASLKHLPKQSSSTANSSVSILIPSTTIPSTITPITEEPPKGVAPKIFVPNFEIYPITHRQSLRDWWEYKIEKKQRYKSKGWEAFIETSLKMDAVKFNNAVKRSMANNWQGLHAENDKTEVRPKNTDDEGSYS